MGNFPVTVASLHREFFPITAGIGGQAAMSHREQTRSCFLSASASPAPPSLGFFPDQHAVPARSVLLNGS
jgi:hypothetical protein